MADNTVVERVERETEPALKAVQNMNMGRNREQSVGNAHTFLAVAKNQVTEWETKLAECEQRLRAWEGEQK